MTARFLKQLIVPFIILLFTLIFGFSILDAPSVSKRVPMVAMGVIVVFIIMTLSRIRFEIRASESEAAPSDVQEQRGGETWMDRHGRQLAFVVLSLLYYWLFDILGFNLTNLLFMLAVLPVVGFWKGRGLKTELLRTLIAAFSTVIVLYLLASVMKFNVPTGILGF